MIKISVVTCTYNASSTVARTLESVLSQEYPCVEHLVIDGCSKDGTLEMVQRYRLVSEARDNGHKVNVISERDRGLYDAMNKGLKLATGDYVVFLNAGDAFPDASTLADVAASAKGKDPLPGVLYGNTDLVDNEGKFLRHRRLSPPEHLTWRSFKDGMLVCHQAFYALTSIARETPYDLNYRFSADVDWCIRVMKQAECEGRSMQNAQRVVVNYLAEGMTTANHKASLGERFKVMCSHYGFVPTVLRHLWFIVRAFCKR